MKRFPSSRCSSATKIDRSAQFTIKSNPEQSEQFEENHDNDDLANVATVTGRTASGLSKMAHNPF
jgi:hypothetical protein